MNKQTEDIRFFTDNLGISKYPVVDTRGSLVQNVLALVGLHSQAELERCAQYLKGKIMAFGRSLDGKCMVIQEQARTQTPLPPVPSGLSKGILIELQA
jgi:hypothetical protein